MNIPVIDRSNYLKGLLVTARLDKQLTEGEKEIIKGFSERLGFASDFYEETIRGLLSNKYIAEDPISFSDKKIARSFISDAVRLAVSDGEVSDHEKEWLYKTAEMNNLDKTLVDNTISNFKTSPKLLGSEFALYSII